jgi:hypothetical protein
MIPAGGVLVLHGGSTGTKVLGCLKPGVNDTTTSCKGAPESIIAAQCCTSGGTCARESANVDGTDKCIAGHSKTLKGAIQALTYAQTKQRCGDLGLALCTQSCAGKGCFYNNHPVYTSLPCGR